MKNSEFFKLESESSDFNCKNNCEKDCTFITFPFVKNGKILEASENVPLCAMTVRSCGSMRFRWNESNQLRDSKLSMISEYFGGKTFVPVELKHSHIVYDVKQADDTKNLFGDGIVTANKMLIPTVTVADCIPIYFFDSVSGAFGIVHSGWKGTGIIADAISLACRNYGAKAENFCVAIGPHINSCCYIVDSVRAKYFKENFGSSCIKKLESGVDVNWTFPVNAEKNFDKTLYRLSLTEANLSVLEKIGIPRENVFVHEDCTCCSKKGFYGSNRRETKIKDCPDSFTVQAAFICFK